MRLVRLFLVLVFAASLQCGLAQTTANAEQQPITPAVEVDFTKSITIFPNPAVDWIHVKVGQVAVDEISITVHNVLGGRMEVESERVNDSEIRLRVKDLAAGYYFLAVKDDEQRFRGTYKFVKR